MTAIAPDAAPPDAAARPPEIEDPTNRLFVHRVSDALLPSLIAARVHPNVVSVVGLLFGVGAAVAYYHWRDPAMATLGFGLMLVWHVLDGVDGKLARATGTSSATGRFLDGVCDHFVYILVYNSLMASTGLGPIAFVIGWSSGAAHAAQALYYEGERAAYLRRRDREPPPRHEPHAAGGRLERGYNRLQARWATAARPIDAALMMGDLAARERLRARYLVAVAPTLKGMTLLGANARTVGLWLSCLAGSPLWFWFVEFVVLTAVTVAFDARLRRIERGLLQVDG